MTYLFAWALNVAPYIVSTDEIHHLYTFLSTYTHTLPCFHMTRVYIILIMDMRQIITQNSAHSPLYISIFIKSD